MTSSQAHLARAAGSGGPTPIKKRKSELTNVAAPFRDASSLPVIRIVQLEAQKAELLGPRRRREVTYNEARLARALGSGGPTPVMEGADEDFAPTATAANTSDDDSGGSDLEERDGVLAGKRVRSNS